MADTDAQVLEAYKTARDLIVANLGSKETIELEIRNRRVRWLPTQASLEQVENLILRYERKTSTAGPARNYARLKR